MGFTVVAGLLSLAETIRLPRVGPYARAALVVAALLSARFIDASTLLGPTGNQVVIGMPLAATILAGWLVVGAILTQTWVLYWVAQHTPVFRRSLAVRAVLRVLVALFLVGSIAPLVFAAILESIAFTGLLFRLALYGFAWAAGLMSVYGLGLLLDYLFTERKPALVVSVVLLCLSSAIQLYLLS